MYVYDAAWHSKRIINNNINNRTIKCNNTVYGDGNSSLIIATLGLDLGPASVLSIVCLCYVSDCQTA